MPVECLFLAILSPPRRDDRHREKYRKNDGLLIVVVRGWLASWSRVVLASFGLTPVFHAASLLLGAARRFRILFY